MYLLFNLRLTTSVSSQVVQHALIGAYGQAGQWQNAIDIFRMMQQSGEEQPTALSYGIIFDACFGKEGTNVFLNTSEPGKLEITPGEWDQLAP
jgi:pentatricopeptide repeat protein